MSLKRLPKPGMEAAAALAGTAFSAMLLVLTAMNTGPLWRDEINTFNLAQMPSLRDMWRNMPFESFPPLWPLLLRGCGFLGLTGSDASIRFLGLCVALFFLLSLWLCSRWMGGRPPILSIALLGSLPMFILIMGANRAYGLAGCLLVLSFGMIWRTLARPSKKQVLWTGLVCLLFAQCLYYDSVFLCAMLAGGALVAIRRQQWKTLWAMVGIGAVSGVSMAIYLPIIQRGSAYLPLIRSPFFNSSAVWNGLRDALAGRSSANPDGPEGPQIWFWIELLLLGFGGRHRHTTDTRASDAEPGGCRHRPAGPGTVLGHQYGLGYRRVFCFPVEAAVFHNLVVLRRGSHPLRHFAGGDPGCELAGVAPLGMAAHWIDGGDDGLERETGVGGSPHPADQCGR